MEFKNLLVFVVVIIGVASREVPTNTIEHENIDNDIPIDTLKTILLCSNDGGLTGVMNCAVSRALKMLQVASKMKSLEVFPGMILESDGTTDRTRKELKDENLPTDPNEKSSKLTSMFFERVARFFSGRTLKINFPKTSAESISRALEEGRGKMKKMMGPLLMGLGVKLMAIGPILLGGVALLSTKALIIAKIALVLSVIIFAQSFFSTGLRGIIRSGLGHGFKGTGGGYGGYGPDYGYGYGGWTTTQLGSQYPYKRSIESSQLSTEDDITAQELAYASHKS